MSARRFALYSGTWGVVLSVILSMGLGHSWVRTLAVVLLVQAAVLFGMAVEAGAFARTTKEQDR